ncbi:MAG: Ig-like domain-containing protein [Bacteroidota bacterium]
MSFKAKDLSNYTVFLKQNDLTAVLGTSAHDKGIYTFTPIVAFTPGKTYEIRKSGKIVGSFTVDRILKEKKPQLVAIYPSLDTVPQNLLKMYFVFSEPMQHSKSAFDFISVFDTTIQEETKIFLEMQTELWNKERTQLTLWLDPGRIKTDLIPNREKGLPLLQNHTYSIVIDSLWTSAQGLTLSKKYSKTLQVVEKDVQRPNPYSWDIIVPKKESLNPLEIHFDEPLDAVLILETIQFKNSKGELLQGALSLLESEFKLHFKPIERWTAGKYSIHVNPVLEDLAGNNLKRLFDTDISNQKNVSEKIEDTLSFAIK